MVWIARAAADHLDRDVALGREAREADHVLRQLDDGPSGANARGAALLEVQAYLTGALGEQPAQDEGDSLVGSRLCLAVRGARQVGGADLQRLGHASLQGEHQLLHEASLVGEVPVETALGHLGGLHDVVDRHAFHPASEEEGEGGITDRLRLLEAVGVAYATWRTRPLEECTAR